MALDFGKNIFSPIAVDVAKYFQEKDIQPHKEILHKYSSQACCLNVMSPLKLNAELAAAALSQLLPGVRKVTKIEFEYTGVRLQTNLDTLYLNLRDTFLISKSFRF